jgi:hypothetical protein
MEKTMLTKGLLFYAKFTIGIGFYLSSSDALLLAIAALILCKFTCIQRWQEQYL